MKAKPKPTPPYHVHGFINTAACFIIDCETYTYRDVKVMRDGQEVLEPQINTQTAHSYTFAPRPVDQTQTDYAARCVNSAIDKTAIFNDLRQLEPPTQV